MFVNVRYCVRTYLLYGAAYCTVLLIYLPLPCHIASVSTTSAMNAMHTMYIIQSGWTTNGIQLELSGMRIEHS